MVLQLLKRKEAPERTQQASRAGAGQALGTWCSMSCLNFRGRLVRGDLRRAARAFAWSDSRLGGLAVAIGVSSCIRQGRDKISALIPQACWKPLQIA